MSYNRLLMRMLLYRREVGCSSQDVFRSKSTIVNIMKTRVPALFSLGPVYVKAIDYVPILEREANHTSAATAGPHDTAMEKPTRTLSMGAVPLSTS
mmetsp:Transcript_7885/g.14532  ORF Transcript_7885/g.14532 Transcript_7885/m.14532 type:complete len:96 (-) Transcript_7885:152-439(-)